MGWAVIAREKGECTHRGQLDEDDEGMMARAPMILESEPWLVSMVPGTCFWRTKSARKSMNAFGGRGM